VATVERFDVYSKRNAVHEVHSGGGGGGRRRRYGTYGTRNLLDILLDRSVDMAISVAHAHANGEEGGGGCLCASIQKELRELEQEMTQRQEDPVKLMQTDLDKLVADINETLDEIRYWGSD
jgi:hypothetical protein